MFFCFSISREKGQSEILTSRPSVFFGHVKRQWKRKTEKKRKHTQNRTNRQTNTHEKVDRTDRQTNTHEKVDRTRQTHKDGLWKRQPRQSKFCIGRSKQILPRRTVNYAFIGIYSNEEYLSIILTEIWTCIKVTLCKKGYWTFI